LPVANARHVVLFDMRGCGGSSRDLGPAAYQPEYVVDDLARLIGVLGHEQVDLLGFSTGGQVAQLFAAAHGSSIRRLALASTTAYATTAQDLTGWEDYKRRLGGALPSEADLDDLETTVQRAINDAPISIWNLDRLDDYLALLAEVRFSGDWLEPWRTGRLHPWRPSDPAGVLRDLGQQF
jgi:pimeloyl-ACP methyl ester carboxylesterase